jgi:eukaryotic-like serine/threonine-protein kinase
VPYMVLEWLDGATFEAVLAGEKTSGVPPRSMAQVVSLLEPAAEALALAHRKGIAHRDVKPSNLFVLGDPRGECTVKLLDFGIAKVVSDAQKMAGTFAKTGGQITSFTMAYGAPEQFSRSHGATGPWTDVFALALVLVEALTGRDPLAGDDFVQLAVASSDPNRRPTPRTLGAKVSDAVEAVFAKALAVRTADRWQTAGDFWNALRKALALDPMRLATGAEPQAKGPSKPPFVTAPTVAIAPSVPSSVPSPASGSMPMAAAATGGGGKGKASLFLAIGLGTAAAILGVAELRGKETASGAPSGSSAGAIALASAVPPTGAVPLASAAPSAGAVVLASGASAAGGALAPPAPCPQGMIAVPGGSFFMGSDEGLAIEKPAHQVLLEPFCIDRFEVTVKKYKACSDEGRCKRAGATNVWVGITSKDSAAFDPLCNIRQPEAKASHPINCVDWEMAEQYCREQGERLPTEAEWEFAARGPDGRKYPWGDDDPAADRLNACGKECMAWGLKNGVDEKAMYDADDGFPNTAPVGSFPKGASRYGVEDVVGNVWEWVADWYGPYSPTESKAPTGPTQGDEKVVRGGSWNGSYAAWVRPTFRYKDAPSKRSYGYGFRCAK